MAPFSHACKSPASIETILSFWFEQSGPAKWYANDPAFDAEIRARFEEHHHAAKHGALNAWATRPDGALALLILLDQFSRNLFRNDPRAFAQDPQALAIARKAIGKRFDLIADEDRRAFFYMPFMHAEDLVVQHECCALFRARTPCAPSSIQYAIIHRDVIAAFGRFPHRNAVLGRSSSPEEIAFLASGGFSA